MKARSDYVRFVREQFLPRLQRYEWEKADAPASTDKLESVIY